MIVCMIVYIFLILWRFCGKQKERKKVRWVILAANTMAAVIFLSELLSGPIETEISRNSYGEGNRLEEYEVTIEGELEEEPIQVEIQEREYTQEQIRDIFDEMMEELDTVILGENESFDHVEKDLKLVDSLGTYPVAIRWEFSNYQVLDTEGRIIQEHTTKDGTLVEVKGILSYREQEAIYQAAVMVYPETKTGKDRWIQNLKELLQNADDSTSESAVMQLPDMLDGKKIHWEKRKTTTGYAVLGFGILFGVLLIWKERQDQKELQNKRREQMERDYPNIVSKVVLLLTTGMTIKQVWQKVVLAYEEQKEQTGIRYAYEEMRVAYNEMQSGISEAESYEHFGRRCDLAVYMKFGALLSQNLRKGSKGLADLLRMESIQAFENRKSTAKRRGEEAGAKLMLPMIGMLAVVLIMVIVPAFLSMNI